MNPKVLKFLTKNRVCALSILLPDGTPHVAALHYAHSEAPLKLFFSTENTSRKTQSLGNGKTVPASLAIGFSESDWITLQLDGQVRALVAASELSAAKEIFYAKNPESKQYEHDPATMFLSFEPSWWRYSNFNAHPAEIIHST